MIQTRKRKKTAKQPTPTRSLDNGLVQVVQPRSQGLSSLPPLVDQGRHRRETLGKRLRVVDNPSEHRFELFLWSCLLTFYLFNSLFNPVIYCWLPVQNFGTLALRFYILDKLKLLSCASFWRPSLTHTPAILSIHSVRLSAFILPFTSLYFLTYSALSCLITLSVRVLIFLLTPSL